MVASVGPYRFVNITCGSLAIQYMRCGVGNTSPHHNKRFSVGKSSWRTTSKDARYDRIDGTENHWVSSW
jgi:hypothetical protein